MNIEQTSKNIFTYKLGQTLFAVTRVCFFEYTRPVVKIFFYHFEMEKIALILIHNIFVTKKKFSGMNIKKFLTRTFLVDPVEWPQTNIFSSLALLKYLQETELW